MEETHLSCRNKLSSKSDVCALFQSYPLPTSEIFCLLQELQPLQTKYIPPTVILLVVRNVGSPTDMPGYLLGHYQFKFLPGGSHFGKDA